MAGFSSVETSWTIVSPFAIERSNRRMILPERVFGRLSPKRISFGFAIGPISLPDPVLQLLDDRLGLGAFGARLLEHDERDDRLHRSGRQAGRPPLLRRRAHWRPARIRSPSCPDDGRTTFRTSSMRPMIRK